MTALTGLDWVTPEHWDRTEWARPRTGNKIHRKGCRYAYVPWLYVEGMTEPMVRAEVAAAPWLRFAKCCATPPEETP